MHRYALGSYDPVHAATGAVFVDRLRVVANQVTIREEVEEMAQEIAMREGALRPLDFELSDEEMERLDGLNEHYSSLAGLPDV